MICRNRLKFVWQHGFTRIQKYSPVYTSFIPWDMLREAGNMQIPTPVSFVTEIQNTHAAF
jgi:hypothetical protein